ncbi:hypothetical protein [Zunongwangia sp. HGR-M22]|uniref:hypothetical protein n=1 Tax=Zunongwangia sp. HGR-M22 TaxID=3015168 RepID=UPI0022DDD0A7|nr:hypothetical protein [Zunongwangia sp. HGR-M22]WBL26277.1 hypothetical protein PBT91_03095 [Zunongwangia sp. HGR-M22]
MGNNRILLFLLLLFCFCNAVFSQQRQDLTGQIVNDSIGEAFVNILNITAETGTVSESDGRFGLTVKENDSILFSSVQFENKYVVITKEIIAKGFLEIELTEEVNRLETVHLNNIKLTGNLEGDIQNIKVKPLMFLPPPRKNLTMAQRKMGSYGGGLGMLIGALNGDLKYLKKAQKNYELQGEAYQLLESIPKGIFVEDFGLEEWEVINFMFYCARNNNSNLQKLIAEDDTLALIAYFEKQAEDFKEISRKGDVPKLESTNENR